MKIKFYKLRALSLLYIARFFAWILRVEVPPVFSVVAIIKKESKLLFLDLSYFKGYGLPGGHVDPGENLDEALKREVKEETGLTVKSFKMYKSYASEFKGIHQVVVSYFVEVDGTLRDSEEGSLCWLEPKEAVNKVFYKDNEYILKDLLKNE